MPTQGLDEDVYRHLRSLAGRIHGERGDGEATLDPTALVHEAWMKVHLSTSTVRDRGHFLAIAARAMRQILVDRARARARDKRGGPDAERTTISGLGDRPIDAEALLRFDDALSQLEALDPDAARIAQLRILAGAEMAELVVATGIPTSTAYRKWRFARAWLEQAIRE